MQFYGIKLYFKYQIVWVVIKIFLKIIKEVDAKLLCKKLKFYFCSFNMFIAVIRFNCSLQDCFISMTTFKQIQDLKLLHERPECNIPHRTRVL